jgi:hypothetical protein
VEGVAAGGARGQVVPAPGLKVADERLVSVHQSLPARISILGNLCAGVLLYPRGVVLRLSQTSASIRRMVVKSGTVVPRERSL